MTSITVTSVTCQYSHIQLVFLLCVCTHTHTFGHVSIKTHYIELTNYINIMSIFMLHKNSLKTTLSDTLKLLIKLVSRNRGQI